MRRCLSGSLMLLSAVMLSGCSNGDVSDLEHYMTQIESRTGGVPLEPLPSLRVAPIESFSGQLSSPFAPPVGE